MRPIFYILCAMIFAVAIQSCEDAGADPDIENPVNSIGPAIDSGIGGDLVPVINLEYSPRSKDDGYNIGAYE